MKLQLKQALPQSLREGTRSRDLPREDELLYAVHNGMSLAGELDEDAWFLATHETLWSLDGEGTRRYELGDLRRIEVQHGVDMGYLWAETKGGDYRLLARFRNRDRARFSYVARGLKLTLEERYKPMEPKEDELHCERCGRALRVAGYCPHCDGGKAQSLRRILRLLAPYKISMLKITLPVLLTTFLDVGMRFLERYFIDQYLVPGEGSLRTVFAIFFVILAISLVILASFIYRDYEANRLGTQISSDLRQRAYDQINALPQAQFEFYQGGELIHRVMHDTMTVRFFVERFLPQLVNQILVLLAVTITMFAIRPLFALMALATMPLAIFLTHWIHQRDRSLWRARWRYEDRLSSRLQDVIQGIRIVKSYAQEPREIERFKDETEHLAYLTTRSEIFWATFFPWVTTIMLSGTFLVLGFGSASVLNGEMTIGTLNQLIIYTGILFGPVGFLTRLPRMLMRFNTSLTRLDDLFEHDIPSQDEALPMPEKVEGAFEFDHLSFGYLSYEPVLEDVSVKIHPGEKIGIVGRSGAGKSTFVNLVMRLYRPDEGRILLDGTDLNEIDPKDYHDHLGVVLQESFLFSGTIAQNIAYADPDATPERIIEAAKLANAHDFITKFADGYETVVGERGQLLSGGERQRIAIARALLHEPSILILDEPTSSLDVETEFQIQEAVGRLTRGRTSFMIAHRLATLKDCDRIMVIEGRTIKEFGTHDELMRLGGLYYELVLAQLEMYKLTPAASA